MSENSVFSSTEKARQLIVVCYDACAYHPETNEVLILKINRGDWNIQIIESIDYYLGYFNNGPWHVARDGSQNPVERQRSAEKDGGRAGSRHGDLKGNREGNQVRLKRRRRTITGVFA